MRLGAQPCEVVPWSLAHRIYGSTTVVERHRHRYEVNERYVAGLEARGMRVVGRSLDGLVEMVEIDSHPWFVTCQFHPEFTSSPRDGHPLFTGFVRAATEEIVRRQGVPRAAHA